MFLIPFHNLGGFTPVLDMAFYQSSHHGKGVIRRVRGSGGFRQLQFELSDMALVTEGVVVHIFVQDLNTSFHTVTAGI